MARTRVGVMPVDPVLGYTQMGLTLDGYCDLMLGVDRITRCAFNGINIPTTIYDNECLGILTQSQRDDLAKYLVQAEYKREQHLGFFLGHKWKVYERHSVGGNNPYSLRHKHLQEIGYPTYADIELDAALDHGTAPFDPDNPPNDPVEVTVTTTVATDEIIVTYPDESILIEPTSIVDNGDGTVTISIPRCRLVDPDYNDDRQDPISYYDTDPFLTVVDVKRLYADVSLGAHFVWARPDCATDCVARCQVACNIPGVGEMAYELSLVDVQPATYSSGTWSTTSFTYSQMPNGLRFSYKSGQNDLTNYLLTARFAHTLMPRPPHNCNIVKQKWVEDREIVPRTFTRYGMTRGAVDCWMFDMDQKIGQGGMFPGMHA